MGTGMPSPAGRCTQARYAALSYQPWWAERASVTKVTFAVDMSCFGELNLSYLLSAHVSLAKVTGMSFLENVREMRYTFNAYSSLADLDLSGFDSSELASLFYTFSGCSERETIWIDKGWTLPPGVVTTQTFYGCSSLVSGAGTVWSSSSTAGMRVHINGGVSRPGYLTVG